MARALAAVAVWLGGTAAAVCLAWFGAGLVVRDTTASPADPAVPVATVAPSASSSRPVSSARPQHTDRARPPSFTSDPAAPRRPVRTRSPSPAPSASGTSRSYLLAGGQVTLLLTGDSARLVTAVPDAGFAVQRWSGPDWLRVDFTSGARVSSLIASWNGHPPSIVTTN
ncbi:MAG TPA: hypothetical protein VHU92_06870 [Streptosporangiaceae bacterium]|nr:hypothetical protein [Streptosporangiaceae bacterium]